MFGPARAVRIIRCPERIRWMGRTCSGCGSGARQAKLPGAGIFALAPPNTLLGFETTSPLFLDCGLRGVLLLHFWWWGVVFDLWIVVASISQTGLSLVGGVFVDVQFFQIGL